MRSPTIVLSCALSLLALAGSASAQQQQQQQPASTPSNVEQAERSFQEGLSLFDAGRINEACVKFSESFALDATALGTLQNLAACHEREGKRALALREWLDLASRAQAAGKTQRETLAREHVVDLSTRLPRVKLRIDGRASPAGGANAAPSNVESVELDGETLDRRAWDKPTSIDPGNHRITFSGAAGSGLAPSTRSFEASEGVLIELDMPLLQPSSATPTAPPTPTPTPPIEYHPTQADEALHARQVARLKNSIFFGGVGLGLLGMGTYFGISAINHRADSDVQCPNDRCNQRGVDLNDRAMTEAWASNIAIGAGLVALGVGVYLFVIRNSR